MFATITLNVFCTKKTPLLCLKAKIYLIFKAFICYKKVNTGVLLLKKADFLATESYFCGEVFYDKNKMA